MSEQVQLRRDTKANLVAFVGAVAELLYQIDESRLVVQDGSTPGGVPVAKLAELAAETASRVAGDVAEAVARARGDSTNAQAIADLTTTLDQAVGSVKAALAAISSALAGKASASDLAANTQFANALYPPERPGDGYGYFTPAIAPTITKAGDFPPIQLASVQNGAEGAAANVQGVGFLLSREFYPVEPGRTYAARVAFSVTQPGLGQAALFGVFQYDARKALIGVTPVILASFVSLFPASGRQGAQALVTRIDPVPAGQFGVDPATRYVRLVVENIDPFQSISVEVMRWVDVTDATVFAPDVASLQNQITQLQSRLDALTANFYVASSVKVSDQDYRAVAADGGVEMVGITADRTVTLPPLATMAPLAFFPVSDATGSAAASRQIVVVPAGGDTINGVPASSGFAIVGTAYGVVVPRAGSKSWLLEPLTCQVAQMKVQLANDGTYDQVQAALTGGPTDPATLAWTTGGEMTATGPLAGVIRGVTGASPIQMLSYVAAAASIAM